MLNGFPYEQTCGSVQGIHATGGHEVELLPGIPDGEDCGLEDSIGSGGNQDAPRLTDETFDDELFCKVSLVVVSAAFIAEICFVKVEKTIDVLGLADA